VIGDDKRLMFPIFFLISYTVEVVVSIVDMADLALITLNGKEDTKRVAIMGKIIILMISVWPVFFII
jgi:hypothetical protein